MCTSCYPCPIDEVKLGYDDVKKFECQDQLFPSYRRHFSCESTLALGISIIEVHYTDNRDKFLQGSSTIISVMKSYASQKKNDEIPKILGSSRKKTNPI